MKTTDQPIVISETYPAPAARVWRAITDLTQMQQWYFENLPAFEAVIGFKTDFLIVNEGREFHHRWQVTDVTPEARLVYEWRVDSYQGRSETVWELKEEEGGTTLTLTCNILEGFPSDMVEFKRESGVEGWNYFLKDRLKSYLEK